MDALMSEEAMALEGSELEIQTDVATTTKLKQQISPKLPTDVATATAATSQDRYLGQGH